MAMASPEDIQRNIRDGLSDLQARRDALRKTEELFSGQQYQEPGAPPMTAARDVMGEYARLHEDVPETQPTDGQWLLVPDRDEQGRFRMVWSHPENPVRPVIALALCRSRLVEWLVEKGGFSVVPQPSVAVDCLTCEDECRCGASFVTSSSAIVFGGRTYREANLDLSLIAAARAGGGR